MAGREPNQRSGDTTMAPAFESLPQFLPIEEDLYDHRAAATRADDDIYRFLEFILGSEELAPDVFEAEEDIMLLLEFELGGADGAERFTRPGPRVAAGFAPPNPSRSRAGAAGLGAFPRARHDAGATTTHHGGGAVVTAATATAAVVSGLKKHKYRRARGGEGPTECVICIEEFEEGDDLLVMPCASGHRFHDKCLAEWLARNRSCPLCRHVPQLNSPHTRFV
ncbi:hypothetical protein ABZP36_008954 [Zizania latifolia]